MVNAMARIKFSEVAMRTMTPQSIARSQKRQSTKSPRSKTEDNSHHSRKTKNFLKDSLRMLFLHSIAVWPCGPRLLRDPHTALEEFRRTVHFWSAAALANQFRTERMRCGNSKRALRLHRINRSTILPPQDVTQQKQVGEQCTKMNR